MKMKTLEYIFDPLCGWCYGAAPLIAILEAHPNVSLKLHGGGMMSGLNTKAVTSQLRDFVQPHDARIAELTGQLFSDEYNNGLLKDETAILDSTPPIAAIIAAEQWDKAPAMLHAIQQAHYVKGLKVADVEVLKALARDIEIPVDEFERVFEDVINNQVDAHIQQSRELLSKVEGNGFPTLFEVRESQIISHPISNYYGKPEAWQAYLDSQLFT
ncbi:DsbA family protein [Cocleimonas flava]|uniref:DSBA-like thioredoxin domain-containing protein n=1 Tax=Cocleimonas flava TaxID=634765 RepID=A0A4R1F756_9GAMM|nr:DsbA family protein [Cocleimonas flava]TCJ87808.1 putative protein-disulfide isomerase [Cocleimonas flava]